MKREDEEFIDNVAGAVATLNEWADWQIEAEKPLSEAGVEAIEKLLKILPAIRQRLDEIRAHAGE